MDSALNLQARSSDDTDPHPAEAHPGLHAFSYRSLTLAVKRGPTMHEVNSIAVHCGVGGGKA